MLIDYKKETKDWIQSVNTWIIRQLSLKMIS